MHATFKKFVVTLTIITLLIISSGSTVLARENSQTEPPDGLAMIADFVVVRPVGIISLVTGYTVFVLSSPFSALGGNIVTAWDKLVVEPADFTFKRPIGCFNQ